MPLPDPVPPALCTIAGYLLDVSGRPRVGIPLRIRNLEVPMTTDAMNWVTGQGVEATSDGSGLVAFQLIQGATVQIDHPFRSDITLRRTVPAQDEAVLIDWLFPYVKVVRYDGDDPLLLDVGEVAVLDLVAEMSDGTEAEIPPQYATVASDDEAVALHGTSGLCAESVGAASLEVTAIDQGFVGTNQTSEGEVLEHISLPDPTLPAAFGVVVS